jgi:signal transduction histidine kinase
VVARLIIERDNKEIVADAEERTTFPFCNERTKEGIEIPPTIQQLQEAWQRQKVLAQQANLLFFSCDAHGIITYLEGRGSRFLSPMARAALGKHFREGFADAPEFICRVQSVQSGVGGTWRVEMHSHVWELRLSPQTDASGRVVQTHGVAENITQRHYSEAQMRWRDREVETLSALTVEVGGTLEFDEVIQLLRRRLEQSFHVPAGAIYLMDFRTFELAPHAVWNISSPLAESVYEYGVELLTGDFRPNSTETPMAPHSLPRDVLIAAREEEGLHRPVSGYVVPLVSHEMLLGLLVLFSPDIYAFHRHHRPFYEMMGQQVGIALQHARLYENVQENREQMRHLARRVVEAQEQERSRLARELHDELGQMLTCLKISLELAERPETLAADSARHRTEAHTTVAQLIQHVRQMSLQLRPTQLDDLGLLPTLHWYIERFQNQTGITIHLSHAGIGGQRFGAALETAAYRIVQEALTNIARYAGTDEAWVDLRRIEEGETGAALDLLIEDAGNGFDTNMTRLSSGLSGMRERALGVDGSFRISSTPGAGTRIEARLPLSTAVNSRSDTIFTA